MRLPLIPPADLSAEQRPLYDTFEAMVHTSGFDGMITKRHDGAFIGPFGVLLHFPEAGAALAGYSRAVNTRSGLPPAVRQVVILTVGAELNSAYELYAHTIAAAAAGLRSDQIASLCAGGRPGDLTPEQDIAADATSALLRGGTLPATTYRAVVDTFGQQAFDLIVLLTVQYAAVCLLLNAYDVPVPDTEAGSTPASAQLLTKETS